VQSFELPCAWISKLIAHCRLRKVDFLSSVFDPDGVHFLVQHGMKKIKLSSCSVTNIPLIEHSARYNLPIIISTGGATLGEVEEAVRSIQKYHNRLSLLYCSIQYPTKLTECNLGVIQTFKNAFPSLSVGYSDHTKEISKAAVQAVYLGATIIEKHITLDKTMAGPDHFFALEPAQVKKMVVDVRKAENEFRKKTFKIDPVIYGSSEKLLNSHEAYLRSFAYTRIFAGRPIKKEARIRASDLVILRPGKMKAGLEPKYLQLFKTHAITAKQNIAAQESITWDMILG
ncbi:MAG: N-acetylneuraminate synthase family protein, partial [Candidatus Omnitrophica bacterium]|nr:N-acetylneuraminate synthase family protein [Candidatus Omnitrophota bacterium]